MNDDPYADIARFYDTTMAGFDADIDLYSAFARRRDAPVLELGVGTGRIAVPLAGQGCRVIGLDRSAAMLRAAHDRLRQNGSMNVHLVRGDMRRPPLVGPFGLIFSARDTFLHLSGTEEHLQVLTATRELLHPQGRLVLDLPGPAGDWGDWSGAAQPLVLDWAVRAGAGWISRQTSYRADAARQTRQVTDIFEETSDNGTVTRHVATYTLRFLFPAEMKLLLRAAGLALDALYGDYDLRPFDADSERMIVVAAHGPPAAPH